MVKLQEAKGRYFVSIPQEYIKKKKWIKGQELVFSFDQDGNLVIMTIE
jgi:arginine repressor